jgi:AcrR family transcriptional regulator
MIQSRPARTRPKASQKAKPSRSRQEVRTAATEQRLLAAAETIFARDGFEAARLEDIAALAGYTRGAFYAHFESKEDIFVGLLEQWVTARIGEVSALLEKQKSPQARLQALRDHYTHTRKDRRLVLLSLEFKLFAIRHPEAHARLRARHQRLRACGGDFVQRVAKALGRELPIPSSAAATGLGALSNALVVEHLFDQAAITDQDIRHILGALFDAILGTATAH